MLYEVDRLRHRSLQPARSILSRAICLTKGKGTAVANTGSGDGTDVRRFKPARARHDSTLTIPSSTRRPSNTRSVPRALYTLVVDRRVRGHHVGKIYLADILHIRDSNHFVHQHTSCVSRKERQSQGHSTSRIRASSVLGDICWEEFLVN